MKILVTGAAGFIGSRLTEALVGHGHEVTGIDNLTTGRFANFPHKQATFVHDDIRKPLDVILAREKWDVIYHAAASYKDRQDWERDGSTNVDGTINVIREAQRTGARLVYFQTSLCYGPNPVSPVQVNAPLDPRGSYAVSKTAGEAYIRDSGLSYVSLRLANVYGPRNLSGPIPTFYKRLTEGQTCTVTDSRRDFVFVDDLVWVAVNAAEQGQGVYHVSSGRDQSIESIYLIVSSLLGINRTYELVKRGPDDVATLLLDPMRTKAEFGWEAMTPLGEGIARAIKWYDEQGVKETYTHLAAAR